MCRVYVSWWACELWLRLQGERAEGADVGPAEPPRGASWPVLLRAFSGR